MSGDMPVTIADAAVALRSGTMTSVALTAELFARADALDATLGTYVARFDDTALAAAAQADADFAAGVDRGPLQGIPLGVKDIIAAREGATTACSKVLDPDWGRGVDAPVVARLRAQGAVITGKTTTMEFAMGAPDADGPFPIHRNPWNLERWPGGSSAGTGTGVAAGLILGGLGSDTGGSVRIPAALCGISGAYISTVYTPLWVEGMIAGKGWIALALTTFATWRPARVLLGAYLFGGVTMLQFHLQGEGVQVPSQFLTMLPYLATILGIPTPEQIVAPLQTGLVLVKTPLAVPMKFALAFTVAKRSATTGRVGAPCHLAAPNRRLFRVCSARSCWHRRRFRARSRRC
jgi:hypothetical protein